MPDQEHDLFPALLAAALYAHRRGDTTPSGSLDGLLAAPTKPLDFSHEDLPEIDDAEHEIGLAA